MNCFHKDLAESQEIGKDAQWVGFYKKTFPGLLGAVGIEENSAWQKHGIDRLLLFSNGKQLTVDEKFRRKDYGDFLAEIWSVFYSDENPRNKPGWTVDASKTCDFIAYALPTSGKCYLLPFEILRLTARKNYLSWREQRPAQNNGYVTINRSVGWDQLFTEMRATMTRNFGEASLSLAKFDEICGQGIFSF